MKRKIPTCIALATVVACVAVVATATAWAAGTTQVDGVQRLISDADPSDPTDDVFWMSGSGVPGTPGLIGYWYTETIEYGVFTPSGVLTATGTELFDGCLDANGNGACDTSDPDGTLRFSFNFSGKFDPATFALRHGRCHHPVIGGTEDFEFATGVLRFKDDPAAGCSYYTGHVTLAP